MWCTVSGKSCIRPSIRRLQVCSGGERITLIQGRKRQTPALRRPCSSYPPAISAPPSASAVDAANERSVPKSPGTLRKVLPTSSSAVREPPATRTAPPGSATVVSRILKRGQCIVGPMLNAPRAASARVVHLGAGEERVPVADAAGEEDCAVAEQRPGVSAASDRHPARRRETAGARIEHFEAGEIRAVVAARNEDTPIGKRGRGVTGACLEHVARRHQRVAPSIEDLERARRG